MVGHVVANFTKPPTKGGKGKGKGKGKGQGKGKGRWEQRVRVKGEVREVGPEVTGLGNGYGLSAPSPGETQE